MRCTIEKSTDTTNEHVYITLHLVDDWIENAEPKIVQQTQKRQQVVGCGYSIPLSLKFKQDMNSQAWAVYLELIGKKQLKKNFPIGTSHTGSYSSTQTANMHYYTYHGSLKINTRMSSESNRSFCSEERDHCQLDSKGINWPGRPRVSGTSQQ